MTDEFWKLGDNAKNGPLTLHLPEAGESAGDEAVITRAIADELQAKVGDEVLLRVAVPSNIPADSTLGEKADATT